MSYQLSTIQFHNQSLVTFEQDGTYYTAMKPICENIGLEWGSQYNRIKRDEVLSQGMIVMIIPSNGGEQEMVCLPIDYLNGWLFGIDVKRVKPEIRDTLIMYKKECYKALADYWMKGKAERSQNTQLDLPLAEVQADEEALQIIVNLYHSLREAHEFAVLAHDVDHRWLKQNIDKDLGGHLLHNLNRPAKNALDKAKKYIHAKSERIMFVKGMLSLLEAPKTKRVVNF